MTTTQMNGGVKEFHSSFFWFLSIFYFFRVAYFNCTDVRYEHLVKYFVCLKFSPL